MTSSAIPLTHDELLRSLTQGDYPQQQQKHEPQINPPQDEFSSLYANSMILKHGKTPKTQPGTQMNSSEEKFVPIYAHENNHTPGEPQKTQNLDFSPKSPPDKTFIPLYAHPSHLPMKIAPSSDEEKKKKEWVRRKEFDEEFHRRLQMKQEETGGGKVGRNSRSDIKQPEDISELLKNLQEIKTTNEEELLKISINEEEDEKTLKRNKFQEEGTLTYNNIKKNTEQEQIVEVYQKPIKKNKKIKELINEDREELKRKSEDLQLQLDELDLCIAQLKGEAEIEPKKISQQTMTSYKDCYHHDNSSDVTSLQSISSRGSSFVSGKNPSPPQNPTPPRRTSSSYETCKRHSERRDSAIDSMKAEENNECQNFNSRASPQISYPPNSSETRPPQQRLPSNFLRQVQFDCDVTEERRSEANNNEGLDILKNGFNNSDTYLDSS